MRRGLDCAPARIAVLCCLTRGCLTRAWWSFSVRAAARPE
jgi:hypothetical protein